MPPIDPSRIQNLPTPQASTLAGPTLINPRMLAAQQEQVRTGLAQHNSNRSDTDAAIRNAIAIETFKQKFGYDPRNPPKTNKDNLPVGEAALADLSPADQAMVKGIVIGKVPVTPYAMARSPQFANLVQHAFAYEPGTDLTLFQRRQAAYSKFFAPNSPTVRVNQALQHLGVFWNAAKGLQNYDSSSVPGLSYLQNTAHIAKLRSQQAGSIRAFEDARNAVATELAAAFKGGNNPAEAQIVRDIETAKPTDSPQQFAAHVQTAANLLKGRIDSNAYQFQNLLGPNATPDDLISPEAKASYERFTSPNFGKAPEDLQDKALSTTSQTEKVPAGYQEAHAQWIAQHNGQQITPTDYIEFRKGLDKQFGTQSDLSAKNVNDFVTAFNAQGKMDPNTPVPGQNTPLTPAGSDWAKFGESAPGQFIEGAANAVTLGLPMLAVGKAGRDAESLAQQEHPYANMAGDVLGSIAPITGLESGAYKLLDKAGLDNIARGRLFGTVGANATYGGVRGFNDSGGDLGKGLIGAGEGGLGGAAGSFVGKGVNQLLPDDTLIALAKLKGVNLTTFQRLGLGKLESSANAAPFIRGATAKAEESMNVDNANRLLANINEKLPDSFPGEVNQATARNNYIYNAANNAYNQVKPLVQGSRTGDFENAINALGQTAKTQEEKANWGIVQKALNQAFDENGHFTGEGFQAAKDGLRQAREDFLTGAQNSTTPQVQKAAAAQAEAAANQLDALAQNQLPASVYQQLQKADQTWAGMRNIQDMTKRALPTREGIYGAPDMLRTAIKADPSINSGLTVRGQMPDEDYALAAQKIMGSKPVPANVGLWPTLAEGGLAAGLGAGSLLSPGVSGALAVGAGAAYLPGVQKVTQALLTGERPAALDNMFTRSATADAIRQWLEMQGAQ